MYCIFKPCWINMTKIESGLTQLENCIKTICTRDPRAFKTFGGGAFIIFVPTTISISLLAERNRYVEPKENVFNVIKIYLL